MQLGTDAMIVGLALVALGAAGCAATAAAETEARARPSSSRSRAATSSRCVLTEQAVERLGLQMAPSPSGRAARSSPTRPSSTTRSGDTWVYTSPKPLTFVRTPDHGLRRSPATRRCSATGPTRGTEVVTVGTAELFGAEKEIGY